MPCGGVFFAEEQTQTDVMLAVGHFFGVLPVSCIHRFISLAMNTPCEASSGSVGIAESTSLRARWRTRLSAAPWHSCPGLTRSIDGPGREDEMSLPVAPLSVAEARWPTGHRAGITAYSRTWPVRK